MALSVQFTDKDNGYDKLMATLRATRLNLTVGVQGRAGSAQHRAGEPGLTVAAVAGFHEFGRGNSPQRSFIRATVDAQRRKLVELERRFARRLLKGTITEHKGLELIGMWLVGQMQSRIQKGIPPALRPATIRRKKGGTTPLIDRGQLIQSITHEVKE